MQSNEWLAFLLDLAQRADTISLRYFQSADLELGRKTDRTLVTQADTEIEAMVRAQVQRHYPQLGVFGEEEGESVPRGKTRLIVDPIDATSNFARGIPIFATLLAIEAQPEDGGDEAGEIVAAVVSAPALARRWHATRGGGAFCGQRRLQVSPVTDMTQAQVFHGSLTGSEAGPITPALSQLFAGTWRQRGFGDFYQHLLVAEGAGEIAVDAVVAPWDLAPLLLIVEEAGGRATSTSGERTIYGRSFVTSNGHLHEEALKRLGGATALDL